LMVLPSVVRPWQGQRRRSPTHRDASMLREFLNRCAEGLHPGLCQWQTSPSG
jgi:hypothetical protein